MWTDIKSQINDSAVQNILAACVFDNSPEGMANVTERYGSHESWRLYGWVENGDIIGVCGFEAHADYVEIQHIAVAENKRRQGVGGKMVAALQAAYNLPIEAETDDDAADFYRKCGFETTAIRKYDVRRWTCVLPVKVPLFHCGLPELPDTDDVLVRPSARGVCVRDGKALMVKYAWGGYGFPGGGIEAGESESDAVCREMLEETGYEVTRIIDKLCVVIWQADSSERYLKNKGKLYFKQENHFYRVELSPAPLNTAEFTNPTNSNYELVWVDVHEALAVNKKIPDRERDIIALRLIIDEQKSEIEEGNVK
jgi:8-oxo-dGTP pyrophosphatase MutT (NUDIX family)/GNAT superfamily N-acetyltransferase